MLSTIWINSIFSKFFLVNEIPRSNSKILQKKINMEVINGNLINKNLLDIPYFIMYKTRY